MLSDVHPGDGLDSIRGDVVARDGVIRDGSVHVALLTYVFDQPQLTLVDSYVHGKSPTAHLEEDVARYKEEMEPKSNGALEFSNGPWLSYQWAGGT